MRRSRPEASFHPDWESIPVRVAVTGNGTAFTTFLNTRGICMNGELTGRKIAILATDGFEQVELTDPKKNVEAAGAKTEVLSVKEGSIKGWKFTDWGDSVRVDKLVGKANVDDYDALILPGGQINPDKLRMEKPAVDFVRNFVASGKPVAAICHGPWMLIEAGV